MFFFIRKIKNWWEKIEREGEEIRLQEANEQFLREISTHRDVLDTSLIVECLKIEVAMMQPESERIKKQAWLDGRLAIVHEQLAGRELVPRESLTTAFQEELQRDGDSQWMAWVLGGIWGRRTFSYMSLDVKNNIECDIAVRKFLNEFAAPLGYQIHSRHRLTVWILHNGKPALIHHVRE